MIRVVPRSGWAIIKSETKKRGIKYEIIFFSLEASFAKYKHNVNFNSSDGCIPTGPNISHLRAP